MRLARRLVRHGMADLNELFGQPNHTKGSPQSRRFLDAGGGYCTETLPGRASGRGPASPSWTGLLLTEGSDCGPLHQGPTHPVFLDLGGWSPPPPAGVAPRFPQGVLTAVRTCAGPGAPLRPRVGSACAACGSHPPSLGAGLRARPPSPCNPRLGLSMSADLWLPDPGLLSPHSRPSPTLPRPLVPGRLPRSACARVKSLSRVLTLCDPMDCSPPGSSVGFSRQEDQGGLPCPPPGDLPDPEIEPESLTSPALARWFLTTTTTGEAHNNPLF